MGKTWQITAENHHKGDFHFSFVEWRWGRGKWSFINSEHYKIPFSPCGLIKYMITWLSVSLISPPSFLINKYVYIMKHRLLELMMPQFSDPIFTCDNFSARGTERWTLFAILAEVTPRLGRWLSRAASHPPPPDVSRSLLYSGGPRISLTQNSIP